MNNPIVKFRAMTLQENINIIKWAFFEDNGDLNVYDYTCSYFPEFASLDKTASKKEIYNKIEEIVTNYYNKYTKRIGCEVKRYNNIWKDYNNKYFDELSKYFNLNFPENLKTIDASVGLIPVFPRFLDSFSFSISTGIEDWMLIETTAHETLHFMWFEKWKKLHPETLRRNYDSPYLEWKYSEMVTDPILNNKPFNQMFEFSERGYDSFYELYDGNELVMDKLRSIYAQNNLSIDEKIENGYIYLNNYFKTKDNVK